MTVNRIVDGLERCDATGSEAAAMARLGFLEWVFAHPGDVTPKVVGAALRDPSVQNPTSAAARAFVEVLREARDVPMAPAARRGRQARVLH
ncbi:hypothetical protein [Roseovarius phycicola]|uniref:Uncharacterized protein n=1 Tax=Roseovarius phycicola TaxID=3080976 RepID=A0ABZ2HKW9_9RHOB